MATATEESHVPANLDEGNEKGANAAVSSPGKGLDDDLAEPVVTLKTWIVCTILSIGYGLSFWAVPVMSAIGSEVCADLGDATAYSWYIPAWTIAITISFLWFGPHTDTLGRRWFLVGGNFVTFIGHLVVASAKYNTSSGAGQITAGMVIIGFGGANCQMAAFALPELLPNAWRHIGVVFADLVVYITVIVAPVTARFGYQFGSWEWNFWSLAIFQFLSFLGLLLLYFPPAHPAGEPVMQVLKEIDWLGMFLFAAGAVPVLMGIVWASLFPSDNAHVVAPLVVGFAFLIFFAVWEHFGKLKRPLTPTYIFTSSWGRDFTAPAIALGVINMFYYSSSILWPTMISQFYTTTDWRYAVELSLPQGFGILFGASCLTLLGSKLRHWQWQLFGSSFVMVLFGSLLGMVSPTNKGTMIAFLFLSQVGFGWAIYLAIALTQMGVEHKDLGIAGGISGTFRFAAGAVATAVYQTVLSNELSSETSKKVSAAVLNAGLPAGELSQLLSQVGTTTLASSYPATIVAAANAGLDSAYCRAIFVVAMVSMAFGIVGLIACACCKDVDHKMNNQIEVYLENDRLADRNKNH
ncbi:Major facilitator superfamily domain, general substrate transporter [Lecanosticta acicola]|uniref:Major facilitator superfamily domain, general substrate transporter n=1 Tax=Lecanosticta acicola TaxID=111012 RepID=A0AAI8Z7C5_9PEZI|nr:Major facilitator superfamily domain, general substrate transporter [Lecanosticta acicola]